MSSVALNVRWRCTGHVREMIMNLAVGLPLSLYKIIY